MGITVLDPSSFGKRSELVAFIVTGVTVDDDSCSVDEISTPPK